MANLNVIGNGFDLYHGLPTSYYYFACYILSTNEELLKKYIIYRMYYIFMVKLIYTCLKMN